jgi:hypothetical protein
MSGIIRGVKPEKQSVILNTEAITNISFGTARGYMGKSVFSFLYQCFLQMIHTMLLVSVYYFRHIIKSIFHAKPTSPRISSPSPLQRGNFYPLEIFFPFLFAKNAAEFFFTAFLRRLCRIKKIDTFVTTEGTAGYTNIFVKSTTEIYSYIQITVQKHRLNHCLQCLRDNRRKPFSFGTHLSMIHTIPPQSPLGELLPAPE